MTEEPVYNLGAIRDLLLDAFTDETLRRLCHDHPHFHAIVAEFAPGQGLNNMVDKVITYCETHLLLPELLVEVAQKNPRQYERYRSRLNAPPVPPAQPAPDPGSCSVHMGDVTGQIAVGQGIYQQQVRISPGSSAGDQGGAQALPEEGEKKGGAHDGR